MAGYGVRIWSFWQDFSQAESIYGKRWQTFLGNASLFQSFGLNDMMTLQHVSDRLGQSQAITTSTGETTLGQSAQGFTGQSHSMATAPLLAPDEIAYHFSRQSNAQAVIYPGAAPIWMLRLNYWDDSWKKARQQNDG